MTITLSALQKQRYDTAANWTAENPTLLAGEIGVESDTGKIKIGTGSTAWTSLSYSGLIPGSGVYPYSQLLMPSGTAGAPSISFDGDTNLGIYRSGTDQISITTGGTERFRVDSAGAATFNNAVTIQGDLTVNGTTTTIDTQNLIVEDKNVIIGNVTTPTDVTADGGGITLKGTTDKTIQWLDATDAWTLSEHVNIASGKEYRIAGTKVLDATSLGSGVLITSANITDGTIVNGDINASAAIAGTKISPDFGSQNVTTTGTNTAASFIPSSSTAPTNGIYLPSANNVGISTNSSERARIDSSGRLLLGTSTTPTQGNGQFSRACIQGNTTGSGGGSLSVQSTVAPGSFATNDLIGSVYFGANTGRDYCSILGYADGNSAGSALATRLELGTTSSGASSPTTRMTIDSSGRVLVGTSTARGVGGTASGQVEIEGGSEARYTVVRNSNDAGAPVIALGKSRGTSAGATTIVQANDTCGLICFAGADGTDIESRCAQIEGVVDGTPGANDMPGRLVFSTTSDGAASPTERARITNAGEVWIAGTTDQGAYNLQVNGTGVWGAGAYVNGSDERLKEDIQPLADASEILRKLRPVSFKYKADYSRDQNIQPGFIAQELQDAMAGQVYLDGIVQQGPEYLNVAYQGLIPVLTKALQEALDKIASLEARIATLEAA